MKQVNVVVWGLGPHAIKNILPALKLSSGINLYGLCSRNVNIVDKYSTEYQCIAWYDSALMLQDPKVDVVYLSTPIGLHADQGRSVLLANKHFWCEKPLAENLEQVSALVNLSRERGLTLAEGFMYLYHPQFSSLQEMIRSDTLGSVQRMTCRFGIPPLSQPGFRTNPQLGGGAFLDVGSYVISAAVSLFPKDDPQILLSKIFSSPDSPVDLGGTSLLRYENGMHVTLEWGINCSYRNEIDFWGSKGSVSSEYFFSKPKNYIPKFRFLDQHGQESYKSGRSENHFLTMFNSFCKLIANPIDAENERNMILRRAQLMDRIKQVQI